VFKILTCGPFPTGEPWDEQVESHLETCADCWRLAEALRPAVEVAQEAIPPAESRNLPGYWGDARPASSAVQLAAGSVRTAVAAGCPRIKRPLPAYERNAATREFSVDVLRTIALAATMTAAALALVVLFRG
jgi:hypothetical protein